MPQLFSIGLAAHKRDRVAIKSVSTTTFLILAFSQALWIVYGSIKADVPVIVASTISCVATTIITLIKIIYLAFVDVEKDPTESQCLIQQGSQTNTNV